MYLVYENAKFTPSEGEVHFNRLTYVGAYKKEGEARAEMDSRKTNTNDIVIFRLDKGQLEQRDWKLVSNLVWPSGPAVTPVLTLKKLWFLAYQGEDLNVYCPANNFKGVPHLG